MITTGSEVDTSNLKAPVESLIAYRRVPLTKTLACATGTPWLSLITPETVCWPIALNVKINNE